MSTCQNSVYNPDAVVKYLGFMTKIRLHDTQFLGKIAEA
ncbi:hypothetical protein PL8927_520024 [Planktothrix serta PCC 8927]|uniref:Uncharacterized protein n=1 Tax=Planktothrix serta PCC 8927 TaxID=671068 RepID=A0A7Z9BP39_9CYAN|nr:hypothetical protein PL8927_520024 [Planktothrix serta PCC 8927]